MMTRYSKWGPEEARRFYDQFGARQDRQGRYEDPPLKRMIEQAAFGQALRVLEFGCGTGRFAEGILRESLPAEARYLGLDISSTMVELARKRLRDFADRARIQQIDGSCRLPVADHSQDRVVANYVLDLLDESRIDRFIGESRRVLAPGGRLCLTNLTHGERLLNRSLMKLWTLVRRIQPRLVGGCRPLDLRPRLRVPGWEILHHEVIVAAAIPSQVLVARVPTGSGGKPPHSKTA